MGGPGLAMTAAPFAELVRCSPNLSANARQARIRALPLSKRCLQRFFPLLPIGHHRLKQCTPSIAMIGVERMR